MDDRITRKQKLRVAARALRYNLPLTVGIISLSLVVGVLEGFGLGFIAPIFELAQTDASVQQSSNQIFDAFQTVYTTIGIPFTLEYVTLGAALALVARYSLGTLVDWLRVRLQSRYRRDVQREVFNRATDARLKYFDSEGSETVVNSIVTESSNASRLLYLFISFAETLLIAGAYFALTVYISIELTTLTVVVLGCVTLVFRFGLESAFTVGNRKAEANEQVQKIVQEATRGLPEVKMFDMVSELAETFHERTQQLAAADVHIKRNTSIINNMYNMMTGLVLFGLVYVGLVVSSLSLSSLGVFLIAMYRLAPRLSSLSKKLYNIDGTLPHVVRTYELIDKLESLEESSGGNEPAPDPVEDVAFDEVTFSYDGDETVLKDVSFSVERGEFVAFVGQSGAGKSTVASLLVRLYEPDKGQIRSDGRPIDEMPLDEWRDRVTVVRQQPFIFNTTLRENLTIGNRDADERKVRWACEIAQLEDVLADLPDGLDTVVGENGVRLSGGQRQRVAIARALLEDADVLVLDEATSDLDRDLEEEIQSAIERLDSEYAMVTIAHRLSTIRNADEIHVVDDGVIVESGTHTELLEQGEEYANLYSGAVKST